MLYYEVSRKEEAWDGSRNYSGELNVRTVPWPYCTLGTGLEVIKLHSFFFFFLEFMFIVPAVATRLLNTPSIYGLGPIGYVCVRPSGLQRPSLGMPVCVLIIANLWGVGPGNWEWTEDGAL
jgi:hypothetical protein